MLDVNHGDDNPSLAKNFAARLRGPLSESADERNEFRLPGQSGVHALTENVAALKSLNQRVDRSHDCPRSF